MGCDHPQRFFLRPPQVLLGTGGHGMLIQRDTGCASSALGGGDASLGERQIRMYPLFAPRSGNSEGEGRVRVVSPCLPLALHQRTSTAEADFRRNVSTTVQRYAAGLAMAVLWCSLPARADEPTKPAASEIGRTRSLRQITTDVQKTLRAQAIATTANQREVAIRQLVQLHGEAAEHEMFATSQTLQRTVRLVRGRLRQVASQLSAALREEPPNRSPRARRARKRPDHAKPRTTVLAQQPGLNPPVHQGGVGVPIAGQPALGDNGPALVDLIQRTISPPIWDVNGGPATMVYFAPRHAVVARAPGETHRDVARLLNGLRRAGR